MEFDGAAVHAMTGGTAAHAAIQRNLLTALTVRLRGRRGTPYGSGLKVCVPTGSVRYPDAFVISVPVPPHATAVTEPAVMFEIVSESSVAEDFVVKNAEYRAIPSVSTYVVLQQTRPACAVFARRNADWLSYLVAGHEAVLHLPEIDLSIPLLEIFAELEFEPDEGSDATSG